MVPWPHLLLFPDPPSSSWKLCPRPRLASRPHCLPLLPPPGEAYGRGGGCHRGPRRTPRGGALPCRALAAARSRTPDEPCGLCTWRLSCSPRREIASHVMVRPRRHTAENRSRFDKSPADRSRTLTRQDVRCGLISFPLAVSKPAAALCSRPAEEGQLCHQIARSRVHTRARAHTPRTHIHVSTRTCTPCIHTPTCTHETHL